MCSLRVSSLLMSDVLVTKTDGSVWTCGDYNIDCNQALKPRYYPIPQTKYFFA